MIRRPLVLIPGLLCDALLWQHQIAGLSALADCWVANAAGSASLSAMGADILAQAPFKRFSLAGLSMGGYLALEIMRQAPERVTSLALLDTTARPDTKEQIARRNALIGFAQKGRFVSVTDALIPLLVAPHRRRDASLVATIRAMARNVGREGFIEQERALISRIDSRPSLSAIRCPTLVMCGDQDEITPVDRHHEMVQAIRGATLAVIGDCGHLSPLEQPEAVNAELRAWLFASGAEPVRAPSKME